MMVESRREVPVYQYFLPPASIAWESSIMELIPTRQRRREGKGVFGFKRGVFCWLREGRLFEWWSGAEVSDPAIYRHETKRANGVGSGGSVHFIVYIQYSMYDIWAVVDRRNQKNLQ